MTLGSFHRWISQPRTQLSRTIAGCVRNHVQALRKKHPDLYGYALLPGEPYDIHSIVAAANTATDIPVKPKHDQYSYYRYSVDEWAHYFHDGFDPANRLLVKLKHIFSAHHKADPDDYSMDEFELTFAATLFDAVVEALRSCRADRVFGERPPFLAVWIPDSDLPVIWKSVRVLNSRRVYKDFLTAFPKD